MKTLASVCVSVLSLLLSGCLPLSTLQTPETLKTGQKMYGWGVTTSSDAGEYAIQQSKARGAATFLVGRESISDRLDIGLRAFGFPVIVHPIVIGGLSIDGKYQFIEEPLLVSGDLEFMVFSLFKEGESARDVWIRLPSTTFVAVNPGILFGTSHFYGGARVLNVFRSTDALVTLPEALAGASMGDKFRFIIEYHLFAPKDQLPRSGWAFGLAWVAD